MDGKARPGGIDGRIIEARALDRLTIEPTNREDAYVHIWAYVHGVEQQGVRLDAHALRQLAAEATIRADFLGVVF